MNTLIVYYSFSGNNRLLAQYLQDKLNCETYEVVERGHRSVFKIVLDLFFRNNPSVEKTNFSFEKYEHVIFIAPIWASRIGTPLRSMIKQHKSEINEYSFISFCGYHKVGQSTKIARELRSLVGKKADHIFELRVSDLFPKPKNLGAIALSRYKAKRKDLDLLKDELNKIVAYYKKGEDYYDKIA